MRPNHKLAKFLGFSWLLAAALLVPACNADDRGGNGDDASDMMSMNPHPGRGGGGGGGDSDAQISGKVLAPDGHIPISGALVYFTTTTPPAIPDGVFCDRCVHLPLGTPYTTTHPDGTFDMKLSSGNGYLVVQKGAFRRVRRITINSGAQTAPVDFTTMPQITDKANGDDIPKIAVVLGAWDPIELVLARMGLKATISKDGLGRAQVLGKDAPAFAIYGVHGFEKSPYPSPMTLLTTPDEINKYHIVFIPCSGSTNFGGDNPSGPACSGVFSSDARVRTTLTGFVKQGGRIYASDWSYEYVRQLFPGFVSWQGQNSQIGSACQPGGGEQSVTNKDSGLGDWLNAQGQSLAVVKDAWTILSGVSSVMDIDADGKTANITPKVWVEAQSAPVSTSFQHGCGRVLYTTYHTQPSSETNGALEPQALALLYLILEVGVCIDPMIPG